MTDQPDRPLDVVFAAERLLPATGGAERFVFELLTALSNRHRVRAMWLADGLAEGFGPSSLPGAVEVLPVAPPPVGDAGYWGAKRTRREAIGAALEGALARHPADVVLGQLHAGPAVVEAARRAGAASLLLLPSYEAFCKYAFDAGSRCVPRSHCRACPRTAALSPDERAELFRSRAAHALALRRAGGLLAPSRAMADVCERWSGRRPAVAPGVTGAPGARAPAPAGHLLLAAARWNRNKGIHLLEPIARGVPERTVVVTEGGLEKHQRERLAALPNVRVRPYAPASTLLRGAGVVLMPSQWPESFGRFAFEGMAAGVPILSSARGGLVEFVPEGQLVRPADEPEPWIRAVRALESPERWKRARERGFAAARGILATDPVAEVEALLRSISATPPPGLAAPSTASRDRSPRREPTRSAP